MYRARDASLQRDVAIKVLPSHLSENPDARGGGWANTRRGPSRPCLHPNILAIHEYGLHEGTGAFAVMGLPRGRDAAGGGEQRGPPLRAEGRGPGRPDRPGTRGCAARRGVVHRDLKPDNLFLTRDGQVKILDFGLARHIGIGGSELDSDSPTKSQLTTPGTVMGTTRYMSPEQVKGDPVDHRTDIFSFGSVLYEMLSGRRAFEAPSGAEAMAAIVKEDPPPLSQAGRAFPAPLERIVSHCLEKERGGALPVRARSRLRPREPCGRIGRHRSVAASRCTPWA